MSTTIKVEAHTKEPRVWKNQVQWGVKIQDGSWVTLHREKKPEKGETIDVNISERKGKNDMIYVDAFPVMPPLVQAIQQPAQQNGAEPVTPKKDERLTWDDYREVAKAAHNLALVLEPDEYGDEIAGKALMRTDRSPARMAFVNTTLIAYSNGKFIVPKEDDDAYVPPEDDIPPF